MQDKKSGEVMSYEKVCLGVVYKGVLSSVKSKSSYHRAKKSAGADTVECNIEHYSAVQVQ